MMYGFGFNWLIMLLIGVPLLLIVIILAVVAVIWFSRPKNTQNPAVALPTPPQNINPTAPGPVPSRYCAHCGAGLQDGWTHCPQCGAPIP